MTVAVRITPVRRRAPTCGDHPRFLDRTMRITNDDHVILEKLIETGLETSRTFERADELLQACILHARRLTQRHRREEPAWPLRHEPSGLQYDTQGATDELAELVMRHRVGCCVDAAGVYWRPRAFLVWEQVDDPGGGVVAGAAPDVPTAGSVDPAAPVAGPASGGPYAD